MSPFVTRAHETKIAFSPFSSSFFLFVSPARVTNGDKWIAGLGEGRNCLGISTNHRACCHRSPANGSRTNKIGGVVFVTGAAAVIAQRRAGNLQHSQQWAAQARPGQNA